MQCDLFDRQYSTCFLFGSSNKQSPHQIICMHIVFKLTLYNMKIFTSSFCIAYNVLLFTFTNISQSTS